MIGLHCDSVGTWAVRLLGESAIVGPFWRRLVYNLGTRKSPAWKSTVARYALWV